MSSSSSSFALLTFLLATNLLASSSFVIPTTPSTTNLVTNDKAAAWSPCAPAAAAAVGVAVLRANSSDDDDDDGQALDLLEYFDPLLSPHAYPNGISPPKKKKEAPMKEEEENEERRERVDIDSPRRIVQPWTAMDPPASSRRTNERPPPVDTDEVFDPRISPHQYAGGAVPSKVYGDEGSDVFRRSSSKRTTVGILLMDHGSRSAASNQRLHDLARLYEESLMHMQSQSSSSLSSSSRVIVRAAHMEIASPSIPDGIDSLLQAGVDEIVCHPYFLSPGRHVKEDIPRIVQNVINERGIDIPVVTTSAIGSNTDIMIGAIHSLVQESSSLLNK